MNKLVRQVTRLSKEIDCQFDKTKQKIVLSVAAGQRSQKISITKQDRDYCLTSVILGTKQVTSRAKRWRELAKLAWHRNAEHQLVTFAFDKQERLVGQIRHPAEHLDYEELKVYVRALARECDRFEYLLSGDDEY